MIRLRPHHLLCTQGYEGKGYSAAFTARMTEVTDFLHREPNAEIEIVFSTDDLCAACPSRLREGVCAHDGKVLRYDAGVAKLLGLGEGVYRYGALTGRLHAALDEAGMRALCGDCAWYETSACQKNVLSGKFLPK